MAFSSTVQVLKVINEEKTAKKTGEKYNVRMAECVLLDDSGAVEVAGPMRLTEALLEGLVPGTYRAGFSMVRETFGDRKGEIVSKCVSLQPVPVKGAPLTRPAAPAASSPSAS